MFGSMNEDQEEMEEGVAPSLKSRDSHLAGGERKNPAFPCIISIRLTEALKGANLGVILSSY